MSIAPAKITIKLTGPTVSDAEMIVLLAIYLVNYCRRLARMSILPLAS